MMRVMSDVEPARFAGALYRRIAPPGAAWTRKTLAVLVFAALVVVTVPVTLVLALVPMFAIAAVRHGFRVTSGHGGLPPYSPSAVAVSILVYAAIVLVGMWVTRWRQVRRSPDAASPDPDGPPSQ